MDIRLIFLNLSCFVISWGVTKFDKSSVLMIWRLSCELVPVRKSVGMKASNDENPEFIEGN